MCGGISNATKYIELLVVIYIVVGLVCLDISHLTHDYYLAAPQPHKI